MEMNAGGTVTVRVYEVQTKDGSFVVTPSAERTTVKGEPRRLSPEPLVVPREPEAAQDNQEAKKDMSIRYGDEEHHVLQHVHLPE